MQWLAHEWQIPADQFPKELRIPTQELGDFIEKYRVNFDWLINGDLKGLREMMWARTARQLSGKIRSLPPDLEKIVMKTVDRLLAEQAAEESEPA